MIKKVVKLLKNIALLIYVLFVILIASIVYVENEIPVDATFVGYTIKDIPLGWVINGMLILGFILGFILLYLVTFVSNSKHKRSYKKASKELEKLKAAHAKS